MTQHSNNNILFISYKRLKEVEEEEELGDITNYATDYSPSSFFKRTHPDELIVDSPAKVNNKQKK